MRLIIFLFFGFLVLGACSKQGKTKKNTKSSNNVDILIQPTQEKPLISLGPGGTKICRRGELPIDTIYGLNKNELPTTKTTTTTTTSNTGATPAATPSFVTTSVGNNWFKIGLLIVNKRDDYWLIIEKLDFVMTANWGNQILKGTFSISSGSYCNSEYLYIISPTPKGRSNSFTGNLYQPFKTTTKNNYFNNLTLYVSGVPLPTTPAVNEKNSSTNTAADNTLKTIRATAETGQKQGGGAAAAPEKFVLDYLPPYKVNMYITGRWIDKSRNDKGGFVRKVRFSLSSRFIN